MSKIGNALIGLGNKMNKLKETKTAAVKEKATEEQGEQFIKSAEETPSAGGFINELEKGVVDPIREMIKEHPDLATFITAMAAGGVAGVLSKKHEEKTELAEYLKELEKVAGKSYRKDKIASFLLTAGIITGTICLGVVAGRTDGSNAAMAAFGATFVTALFGGVGGGIFMYDKRTLSKDRKFLIPTGKEFITIPPSGDKLIFCDVFKDSDGRRIRPSKVIDLPKKATHLSFDKDNFYVNYEDPTIMTKFSFDKNRQEEVNLLNKVQIK